MPPHDPTDPVFVAHPPERRRHRTGPPAQAGMCCCCCCCCLHSVGGLVGAAVAPVLGGHRPRDRRRTQEEDDYADTPAASDPAPGRTGISAVALFWGTLLVLVLLCLALTGLSYLSGNTEAIWVGIILLLLGLPVLQLLAAVPPAIYLGFADRTDKGYEFGQLGRILAGVCVGTVLGIVVMVMIGLALRTL